MRVLVSVLVRQHSNVLQVFTPTLLNEWPAFKLAKGMPLPLSIQSLLQNETVICVVMV